MTTGDPQKCMHRVFSTFYESPSKKTILNVHFFNFYTGLGLFQKCIRIKLDTKCIYMFIAKVYSESINKVILNLYNKTYQYYLK